MGCLTVDCSDDLNLARAACDNFTYVSAGVKNDCLFTFNHGPIHVLDTVHTAFFTDGEEDLSISARNVVFFDHFNCFHNSSYAALVVACKDCGTVCMNNAVCDDRFDTVARFYCIEVCRENCRLAAKLTRHIRVNIVTVGAKAFAGFVSLNFETKCLKVCYHSVAHIFLILSFTVDLNILKECVQKSLFINHCKPLLKMINVIIYCTTVNFPHSRIIT